MNELFALIKAEEQLTSALSVGSYIVEPVLQEKTVQPTREEQEITYDYGFNGLEKVIVEPYEPILQTKTITPTTEQQVITADSGNDGLSEVVVNGVDSSIDADIQPNNIRKGVNILGVNGSVVIEDIPQFDFGTFTINSSIQVLSGDTIDFILNNSRNLGVVSQTALCSKNDSASGAKIHKLDPKYDVLLTTQKATQYTDYNGFFENCWELEKVSHTNNGHFIISSNANSIRRFFRKCKVLKYVDMDFLSITNTSISMTELFNQCNVLEEVINLDLTNANDTTVDISSGNVALKKVLFKQGTVPCANVASDVIIQMPKANSAAVMTKQGIINAINSLGVNNTGYVRKLRFSTNYKNILTADVIALGAEKNYLVSQT